MATDFANYEDTKSHYPVIIMGAGLSGLAAAIQLKRLHQFDDLVIYEKSNSIGGTWAANTYPGGKSWHRSDGGGLIPRHTSFRMLLNRSSGDCERMTLTGSSACPFPVQSDAMCPSPSTATR